jgi:hypothetical protein
LSFVLYDFSGPTNSVCMHWFGKSAGIGIDVSCDIVGDLHFWQTRHFSVNFETSAVMPGQ